MITLRHNVQIVIFFYNKWLSSYLFVVFKIRLETGNLARLQSGLFQLIFYTLQLYYLLCVL